MKQVTSGWAVIASSTLCLARAWSTSSARISTSSTFEPLMVSRTPSIRSRALSADGRPTKRLRYLPPLDGLAPPLDTLTRIVGGRQTDEAHALAAVGQRFEGELTRLLAG